MSNGASWRLVSNILVSTIEVAALVRSVFVFPSRSLRSGPIPSGPDLPATPHGHKVPSLDGPPSPPNPIPPLFRGGGSGRVSRDALVLSSVSRGDFEGV